MNSEQTFLASATFAVAGASNNREKYGNIVFRHLSEFLDGEDGRVVYPVHPKLEIVEGTKAYKSVGELPVIPEALSIVTPPPVTRKVVQDAIQAGVKSIWMQPGAEDNDAIYAAKEAGIDVIAGGPCILVVMKIAKK